MQYPVTFVYVIEFNPYYNLQIRYRFCPHFTHLDAERSSNYCKITAILCSCGDCQLPWDRDFLLCAAVLNAQHSAWYTGVIDDIYKGKGQALNPDLLNSQI